MNAGTRILGFGNPWAGDDGFGPAVLSALSRQPLPPGVELVHMPPLAWDGFDHFAGCRQAIIVDAISAGRPAGTLAWFAPNDLADDGGRGPHGLGLGGLLRLLPSRLEHLPAIRILGAEPQSMAAATPALSPALMAAVMPAVSLIRRALQC